jgi:hypothetical protein
MHKVLNILGVVKSDWRTGALVGLLLVTGFAGVDAFEDTQTTEVRQRDLQFPDRLGSGNKVLGRARRMLLLDTHCVEGKLLTKKKVDNQKERMREGKEKRCENFGYKIFIFNFFFFF